MDLEKRMNIREQMLELRGKLLAEIALHQDDREKIIGDRVKVWDGSCNIDKRTGEFRSGIDPLFEDNDGIIIQTDCNIEFKPFSTYSKVCDVLIRFPDGEEVYCASSMIKRIDNHSK